MSMFRRTRTATAEPQAPAPAPADPARVRVRVRETYDVADENIGATLAQIRRAGGRVVRSSPVSSGYVVTVEWAS